MEEERYEREPFIEGFARFREHTGERVLEVGIGAGTDFTNLVRSGALATGVDLTEESLKLVERRLELEGLHADLRCADAERLPFPDESFDFVYSWGVIHHTPNVRAAAAEIVRVTRPGGRVCVMVYNRHSLVAAQAWLVNGLLRGRPLRTLDDVIRSHIESPGTQAFTESEARELFPGLDPMTITPVVTPYDVRLTRSRFASRWVQQLVPSRLSWFLVVEGTKALH